MAIYYGHFSAMPIKFEPPRAGTMPERTETQTFLGPNQYLLKDTERAAQSTGLYLRRSKK